MRICSIDITNFRAIRRLQLSNLSDAIVIAGVNGSGKSTVFDAIRLLKSAYGEYHPGEFQRIFGDFEIQVQNLAEDAEKFLFDPTKPLKISVDFEFSSEEVEYLKANARETFLTLTWKRLLRRRAYDGDFQVADPSANKPDGEIVATQADELAGKLLSVVDRPTHTATLSMEPGKPPGITGSPVLELVLAVYEPSVLGVIDYQAPNRFFPRDNLSNINLRIKDANNQRAQRALTNDQHKYTGVKTEMAQSYVSELIAERAGVAVPEDISLKATLDELFHNFFPGKEFLGAIPTKDGGLKFPIRLDNGREHDINELSSGEKEVLLGYLRLRNSAPRNSIILLDEPELHLNPRLARSLPRFYEKHLGKALNNQIWLVTHSDAILREAVHEPSYSVYHMQPAKADDDTSSQADRVEAGAEIESALISLTGDLASYNPRSKVVMIEGEGAEFDARMLSQLFPSFAENVNLISLGQKSNVTNAQKVLEKAAEDGKLDARFFSITDRDFFGNAEAQNERTFTWDVYHIENYLLEPAFIGQALEALTAGQFDKSEDEITALLRKAAEETIDEIIRVQLTERLFADMRSAVSLKFDKGRMSVVDGLSDCMIKSVTRLQEVVDNRIGSNHLDESSSQLREQLQNALGDGSWKSEFRGRDVLKRFVSGLGGVAKYEQLRNLILSRMKEANHEPTGMKNVIDQISDA